METSYISSPAKREKWMAGLLILVLTTEKRLPQVSLLAHPTTMSWDHHRATECREKLHYAALLPSFQKTEGNLDNSCMRSATCSSSGQLLHLTIFPLKEINISTWSISLMQSLPVERVIYSVKTFTPLSCYLHGAGSRVASSMLALLLASRGGRRLRMRRMRMQGSIRVGILLSKWASGN